jgi:hypothetical protein
LEQVVTRKQRRATQSLSRKIVKQYPDALTPIPPSEWPFEHIALRSVWVSKKYLVQLYDEASSVMPILMRLSICRTVRGSDDRWVDGIHWDELQAVKCEVGFGDWFGLEIYPREADVVNDANFRHLWLLPFPLPIGWVVRAGEV